MKKLLPLVLLLGSILLVGCGNATSEETDDPKPADAGSAPMPTAPTRPTQ